MEPATFEPRVAPRGFWPVAILDEILRRVGEGESLSAICEEPSKPTRQCFYNWISADQEVAQRYTAAVARAASKKVRQP